MALPGSGTITIDDLRTEFGATGTRGLSDFYRGGAFVPDTPTNAGVPTSGIIALSDFYNASADAGDAPTFFIRKTATTSRSFNTTLSADPQLTIASIPAGSYIMEAFIRVASSSTLSPGHWQFAFTAPTLSASALTIFSSGETTAYGTTSNHISAGGLSNITSTYTNMASTNIVAVTNQVGYHMRGSFISTASGSFTLTWAQNSSASNATSVENDSWIKLWEVT